MSPNGVPPIVTHGPWRSAEPTPLSPPGESTWATLLGDLLTGIFDVIDFDLFDLIFGFFRVVAHVIVVVLHAVFHL